MTNAEMRRVILDHLQKQAESARRGALAAECEAAGSKARRAVCARWRESVPPGHLSWEEQISGQLTAAARAKDAWDAAREVLTYAERHLPE